MRKFVIVAFLAAWALLSAAVGFVLAMTQALPVGASVAVSICTFLLGGLGLIWSLAHAVYRDLNHAREDAASRLFEAETQLRNLALLAQDLAGRLAHLEAARSTERQPTPSDIENGLTGTSLATVEQNADPLPDQIASAILSNRIDLYIQPVHALPSRRPVFFECLSRLRNEVGDVLYPSRFLDYATRSRLITTLDNFLLLRCVQIVRQYGKRTPLETFFVNLSATSLSDPEFFEQFVDFLCSNEELRDNIVLEVAAPELPHLRRDIGDGLDRLVQTGYRFSLDHASLNEIDDHTSALGVHYVKVPAQEIVSASNAEHLAVRAKACDLVLIATHVEDEKTVLDLIELGVDHAQGFVFGRPRTWDDVLISKGLLSAA